VSKLIFNHYFIVELRYISPWND